jgi:predicted nuclease of restriction endonuclease-like RecB superfamily
MSDQLFDGYMLSAQQMFDLTEQEYGLNDHFELSNVMRQANKLWKIMNRIQNGEKVYKVVLEDELENFIKQGQKINAIKHYRRVMEKKFGKVPTLRASKDYIDSLQSSLSKI